MVWALSAVSAFQVGCFQPESSLASRGEERVGSYSAGARIASEPSMDRRTVNSLNRYGPIVQKYSHKYELDWRLVMAVMRHESGFTEDAVSNRGAFGLMQIMPATRIELAGKLGMDETETPSNNINAGVYHLQQLFKATDADDEENHIRLTLAAYNAGINRILDAQDVAAYLGYDPCKWDAVKSTLPLLARRYENLHHSIWSSGRPRAGYFTDWRQTVGYVESVMSYYDRYLVALK